MDWRKNSVVIQSLFPISSRDTYINPLPIILTFHQGNAFLVYNILWVVYQVNKEWVWISKERVLNACLFDTKYTYGAKNIFLFKKARNLEIVFLYIYIYQNDSMKIKSVSWSFKVLWKFYRIIYSVIFTMNKV